MNTSISYEIDSPYASLSALFICSLYLLSLSALFIPSLSLLGRSNILTLGTVESSGCRISLLHFLLRFPKQARIGMIQQEQKK